MEFAKDVVIDSVCYRRYGHNEGDEPYFTQPLMYERIRERAPLYKIYGEQLIAEKIISEDEAERIETENNQALERSFETMRTKQCVLPRMEFYENWEGISGDYSQTGQNGCRPEAAPYPCPKVEPGPQRLLASSKDRGPPEKKAGSRRKWRRNRLGQWRSPGLWFSTVGRPPS
jgi:type III secretion system FlhB-like substrate exporter